MPGPYGAPAAATSPAGRQLPYRSWLREGAPHPKYVRQLGRTSDGICSRQDDNGQVAAKRREPARQLMADWARRVAGFFRWAETRPVLSGSSYAADVGLAVVVTIAAVVAASEGYLTVGRHRQVLGDGSSGKPPNNALHDLLGPSCPACSADAPGADTVLGPARRRADDGAARVPADVSDQRVLRDPGRRHRHQPLLDRDHRRGGDLRRVLRRRLQQVPPDGAARLVAGAIVITLAYPQAAPQVPERFTALLVLLPTVAAGNMMRIWRQRADDSADRLRRAQAEHEADTRRAVELERARIASELHDVVTHNVSVMVVQAGAARRVLDSSPGDAARQLAREALLAIEASGRTAMTELRHLLGLLAPSALEVGPGAAGGLGYGPAWRG